MCSTRCGKINYNNYDIHLILDNVPPNIRPYQYPYSQKNEIDCMVVEMLEAGIISPSQISYSTPVVMVPKQDGSWCMCPDYREINKINIKYIFPFQSDELLDELHGAVSSQCWIFVMGIIRFE